MGAIITALTVWRLVNLGIKGPWVQKGSHVGTRLWAARTHPQPKRGPDGGLPFSDLPRVPSPAALPAAPRTGAHVDLLHPGVHHRLLALRARRPLVRQQQRARGGAAPRRDSRGGGAWSAVPRGRRGLRGRAGVRAGDRGLLGSRGAGAATGVGAGGGGSGVQAPGVAGLARPRRVVGRGLAGSAQVRGRQVRGGLRPREAGTPARAAVPTARAAVRRELLEGRELGLDVVGVYQKRAHGH